MFTQHPRVGRFIVSEKGVLPVVPARIIPGRIVERADRFRVFAEYLGRVVDLAARGHVVDVPRPVEHGDELIFFAFPGFPVFPNFAAEPIGRRPEIAVYGLGRRVAGKCETDSRA